MSQIHTLSDIGEGKKLGDMPTNRYPSSRTKLENQLVCANQDWEIAIKCGNRLANKCSILDKENKRIQHNLKQFNKDKEKLSKHAFQLIDEVKRLKMSQIHTLSDIGEGKKLGDMPTNRYPSSRTKLENQLVCANQDWEIAIKCGNRLANKCSILDKENKRIQHNLKQFNKDKEKLSKHAFQLIDEVKRLKVNNTNLTFQITQSQISRDEYKARYDIQLKKIKSLQAIIKILEGKLASAQKDAFSIQNDSSKKESEIISLKSKIIELE
ncbi:hypothetical protein Glove_390g76 [Diversispora epigaea]|uniref:Uncharacterized protein n=1 Tax=Diversispora epigaea TaxID=1348612 RepID=A0A397H2J4_9GLOM|nr:hypothetical protein Glove_390g76 [Diversispora epigaea]